MVDKFNKMKNRFIIIKFEGKKLLYYAQLFLIIILFENLF